MDSVSLDLGSVVNAANTREIKRLAEDMGITLTDEQASDIAARGGDPVVLIRELAGKSGNSFQETLPRIENQGFQNTKKEVADEVDKSLHPEKYLTPEQLAKNKETASRLISGSFGSDFSDPDFEEFISLQLAKGTSPYELTQLIQQDPRYIQRQQEIEKDRVSKEALSARNALSQSLLDQEDVAFDRTKKSIIGSFMSAGRLNSSGLDAALARARENLQRDRQAFLANIGYEDAVRQQGYGRENFLGRQNSSYQNYLRASEPGYQQQFNIQNAKNYANFQSPWDRLNRSYSVSDSLRQRGYENEDYFRSKNDYFEALGRQGKMQTEAALYGFGGQLLGSAGQVGLMKWAGAFK